MYRLTKRIRRRRLIARAAKSDTLQSIALSVGLLTFGLAVGSHYLPCPPCPGKH